MAHKHKPKAVTILFGGSPGSGKDAICKELIRRHPEIERVIRYTTRSPREGEKHGFDYFFETIKSYRWLLNEGKIQGDHRFCDNRYAFEMQQIKDRRKAGVTTVGSFGRNALDVKEEIGDYCITIYLRTDITTITKRLNKERPAEASIETWWRVGSAIRDQLTEMPQFDFVVVSDGTIEDTMVEVERYLKQTENERGFRIIGFNPKKVAP